MRCDELYILKRWLDWKGEGRGRGAPGWGGPAAPIVVMERGKLQK